MSCALVKRFRVLRGASPSTATSSRLDWVSTDDMLDAEDVLKSELGAGSSIAGGRRGQGREMMGEDKRDSNLEFIARRLTR